MNLYSSNCSFGVLSYKRLFKKPLLFRLFVEIIIEEFDNIYKKYRVSKLKHLSKRKISKRGIDVEKHQISTLKPIQFFI